jgi:hypothetical protein
MPLSQWTPYARIGRPLEAHGVSTPEVYRAAQAAFIRGMQAARPWLAWRDPFVSDAPPASGAVISGGCWKVVCDACGNAPAYDPDWQLACCFECGAIYQNLPPPTDWDLAEQVLLSRAAMATRNWWPGDVTQGNPTVATLVIENGERADPVSENMNATLLARAVTPQPVVPPVTSFEGTP